MFLAQPFEVAKTVLQVNLAAGHQQQGGIGGVGGSGGQWHSRPGSLSGRTLAEVSATDNNELILYRWC